MFVGDLLDIFVLFGLAFHELALELNLAIVLVHGSHAVHQVIFPITFVLASIPPLKNAFSMSFALDVVTSVSAASIAREAYTVAINMVVFPVTFIHLLRVTRVANTVPIHLIALESTDVLALVGINKRTFAVHCTIRPLAIVPTASWEGKFTISVLFIMLHFASVCHAIGVLEHTGAMHQVMSPIAFITLALPTEPDLLALAMPFPI